MRQRGRAVHPNSDKQPHSRPPLHALVMRDFILKPHRRMATVALAPCSSCLKRMPHLVVRARLGVAMYNNAYSLKRLTTKLTGRRDVD